MMPDADGPPFLAHARLLYRQLAPCPVVIQAIKTTNNSKWTSFEAQEAVHRALLCDPLDEYFPLASEYRARFIRLLCKELEENLNLEEEEEIIDPLLRELNTLLLSPSSCSSDLTPALSYVTFDCPVVVVPKKAAAAAVAPEIDSASSSSPSLLQTVAVRIAPKDNAVGLKLWEAGFVLADSLLAHPELCQDRHVVELGAGVGLLGLVAAYCLGARRVTITDIDEEVLKFVRHNIEVNDLFQASTQTDEKGGKAAAIEVESLDWTEPGEYTRILAPPAAATAGDEEREKRTIVAADCIYDRTAIPAFVDVLAYALRQPEQETIVLVASTMRNPETYAYFEEMVAEKGDLVMEDVTSSLVEGGGGGEDDESPFYCPNRAAVHLCRISLKEQEQK